MYIDTHCHLEMVEGELPLALVNRASTNAVVTLLTVGVDLASSAECVQTASALDSVKAVVGIHPHNAIEATDHVLAHLKKLAAHPEVVGIGETGLDYFRDHSPRPSQQAAFRKHIQIAKALGKTLVVHCRDAHEEVLGILLDQGAPERTVFHCFSGDVDFAKQCAQYGWYMSFAGNVTFTNAAGLRQAAASVPPELLLTETDSPYLSPHPLRGQRNEPARVTLVAAKLAEVHGMRAEQMGELTAANARRAFALPSQDDGLGQAASAA